MHVFRARREDHGLARRQAAGEAAPGQQVRVQLGARPRDDDAVLPTPHATADDTLQKEKVGEAKRYQSLCNGAEVPENGSSNTQAVDTTRSNGHRRNQQKRVFEFSGDT